MSGPCTDHHVHFLSAVAARLSVDVSAAAGIDELVSTIRSQASGRGWVRAWGYEEWRLDDRRSPTRFDLDGAAPGRPVVLHHRTGHAAVLSSAALAEVGEADHPDGLLVDRHDLLGRVPRLDPGRMGAVAADLSRDWEGAGVGAFVDATHTNGAAELELLAGWCSTGVIRQAVTAMVGAEHLASVPAYRARVGAVRVGPAKVMPAAGGPDRIGPLVAMAHAAGFPAAVHVVEVDALERTLGAFEASPAPEGTHDRIEHNALSLPEQLNRIAGTGAVVVVNPSFLMLRRGKYERELTPLERTWLIRMASLVRAGVEIRAGSDAPITPARPELIRRAAQAHPFAPGESLGEAEADRLLAPLTDSGRGPA